MNRGRDTMKKKEIAIIISILVVALIGIAVISSGVLSKAFKKDEKETTTKKEQITIVELSEEEKVKRSEQMMADKRNAMKEYMTDADEKVTMGDCVVSLEKMYFDGMTDDGCFLISIKMTDGSDIEENLEMNTEAGEFIFGEMWRYEGNEETGPRDYPRYAFITELYIGETYIEDKVLYIYGYVDECIYYFDYEENNFLAYVADMKRIEEESTEDDIPADAMLPIYVADEYDNRSFNIKDDVEINISAASLTVQEPTATRNLSIVFKDGSEVHIVVDKKVDEYTLVDHKTEHEQKRKYTFNKMIDIEEIDCIRLNNEEYYPE